MHSKFLHKLMRSIGLILVRDGYLRSIYCVAFSIIGGGLVFLDLDVWETGWVYFVGLAIAGIGGYAARAHQLGIRSFEGAPYPSGWLKSRRRRMSKDKDEIDKEES